VQHVASLWCGDVIGAADRIVYFAGDTGFSDHLAQIRERFGAPRLALLPIGTSRGGLCRPCTWLPTRRFEPMAANRRESAGHPWETDGDPTPDPADTETTVVYLLK
jgi:L-ascorbate metabolism protein UlaG (beta-lactamase superfamily)